MQEYCYEKYVYSYSLNFCGWLCFLEHQYCSCTHHPLSELQRFPQTLKGWGPQYMMSVFTIFQGSSLHPKASRGRSIAAWGTSTKWTPQLSLQDLHILPYILSSDHLTPFPSMYPRRFYLLISQRIAISHGHEQVHECKFITSCG